MLAWERSRRGSHGGDDTDKVRVRMSGGVDWCKNHADELMRDKLIDAWDNGFGAGHHDGCSCGNGETNPYRDSGDTTTEDS